MMIKDFFLRHPITKIIALVLSITLWLIVHGDRQKEITVDIPIKYVETPDDLMSVGQLPTKMRIRLRGQQTRLSKIDESYFPPHEINLSTARRGVNTYWVYEEDFKVPFGVSVTRVYPQAIRLELDFAQVQWVAVEPKVIGSLSPGYLIEDTVITPSRVRVRLPRQSVDQVKKVFTQDIDLNDRKADFEGEYYLDDRSIPGEILQERVNVSFKINENQTIKTISVPIQRAAAQVKYRMVPETVSLKVKGRESLVMSVEDNLPMISLDQHVFEEALRTKRSMEIPLIYQEFPGLEMSVEPQKVKVVFE
ncbi:MAG: CdaR family protein [Bdellovibrionota bacterium]